MRKGCQPGWPGPVTRDHWRSHPKRGELCTCKANPSSSESPLSDAEGLLVPRASERQHDRHLEVRSQKETSLPDVSKKAGPTCFQVLHKQGKGTRRTAETLRSGTDSLQALQVEPYAALNNAQHGGCQRRVAGRYEEGQG